MQSTGPVTLTPVNTGVTVLSLPLSPTSSTNYVIFANVGLRGAGFGATVTCTLNAGGVIDTEVNMGLLGLTRSQLVLSGDATLSGATTVTVSCTSNNNAIVATSANITAIQVGSLS